MLVVELVFSACTWKQAGCMQPHPEDIFILIGGVGKVRREGWC